MLGIGRFIDNKNNNKYSSKYNSKYKELNKS
jgi:hypothetical protein